MAAMVSWNECTDAHMGGAVLTGNRLRKIHNASLIDVRSFAAHVWLDGVW